MADTMIPHVRRVFGTPDDSAQLTSASPPVTGIMLWGWGKPSTGLKRIVTFDGSVAGDCSVGCSQTNGILCTIPPR
jgi:hypothetical protein